MSISPPPSAALHRTELTAKATIAAVVRRLTYLTRTTASDVATIDPRASNRSRTILRIFDGVSAPHRTARQMERDQHHPCVREQPGLAKRAAPALKR